MALKRDYGLMAISLLLLRTTVAWAQQKGSPAGTDFFSSSEAGSGQSTVNTSSTGTNTTGTGAVPSLLGGERFSPGSTAPGQSYLQGSFQWSGFADSNPFGGTGGSQLSTSSSYVGSIALQRARRRSQLNLDYSGGAFFFSSPLEGGAGNARASANGMFHSFDVAQGLTWRRWLVRIRDDFAYLPESPFGFADFSGLGSFGSGLGVGALSNEPTLSPLLEPSQTILTGRSRRISNVAVTEVQYRLGERSSISATAAYGTLHFFDAGFADNRYSVVVAGYNHALTRRDTLSIYYVHNYFQFDAANQNILTRGVQLAYGHKLTGKLAIELAGGPVVNQIGLPLGGARTSSFWSSYGSLQYLSRKYSADLSFLRSVTGGSGVVNGAESDLAQLQFSRQLGRKFRGSLGFGHVFNQALSQSDTEAALPSKFEVWETGLNLSREFGRNASMYFHYSMQRQTFNRPLCFGPHCALISIRHVGGVGFNWHTRPFRIR